MSYRLNDPDGSRTDEEAKKNLYERTWRENKVKPVISKDLEVRFGKAILIEDNGVDNSGEYIEDDSKVTSAPDWLVRYNGIPIFFEVLVHSEKYDICSFKIPKIERTIKNSDRRIIVVRENHYYLVDSLCAKIIEEIGEYIEVKGINGGKPSIRLYNSDLNLLVKDGRLKKFAYVTEAQKLIDAMKAEVFP